MAADEPEHLALGGRFDPAKWRAAAAEGRLAEYEPGTVLRAFWQARSLNDERLEGELACHLSDVVLGQLKRKVKSSLPDGGLELVAEVHHKIMVSILDPDSADGKALADHFAARLHFRFLDAAKRQRGRQKVELPSLVGDDGSQEVGEDPAAGCGYGGVDVGQALSLIRDERKRLAFIMTMANHPKGDIATMLKIDLKTLYFWLREVREFLKTELDL